MDGKDKLVLKDIRYQNVRSTAMIEIGQSKVEFMLTVSVDGTDQGAEIKVGTLLQPVREILNRMAHIGYSSDYIKENGRVLKRISVTVDSEQYPVLIEKLIDLL